MLNCIAATKSSSQLHMPQRDPERSQQGSKLVGEPSARLQTYPGPTSLCTTSAPHHICHDLDVTRGAPEVLVVLEGLQLVREGLGHRHERLDPLLLLLGLVIHSSVIFVAVIHAVAIAVSSSFLPGKWR